jgi:hypothetical protein
MATEPNREDDERWRLIRGVFLTRSLRDSITPRGGRRVYTRREIGHSAKLRDALTGWLVKAEGEYEAGVCCSQHLRNIQALRQHVLRRCRDFLNEHTITFGVAQKVLNTYLKYLWCDGRIPAPPHCPFDEIILRQLERHPGCEWRWTYGNKRDYLAWVSAARAKAAGEPLCDWELRVYRQNNH